MTYYDELPFWSAPFGISLLDTVRVRPGMNVLDIGSGSGFPMLELAERLDRGSHVTGIDPSPESFRLISDKIGARRIDNAGIISGKAEELPFGNEEFDLVISNNGLNNVDDLQQAARECFRVLRPGGQMVFTLNLPHTFTEFYQVFEEVLSSRGMSEEKEKVTVHIFEKRKPVDYLQLLLLGTGFTIASVRCDGFRYRFENGNAFLNHPMIRDFFLPAWKRILPDDPVAEDIIKEAGQRLNRIAADKGWLDMSVPFATFDLSK